jgi:hypothetical protein
MPSWGLIDQANNAPKYGAMINQKGAGNAAQLANTTALYMNTTPNAFLPDKTIGMFAVNAAQASNTGGEGGRLAHAGWNLRKAGEGPVSNIAPLTGGIGYSNTDLLVISGGSTNATGTLATNATGGIIATTLTAPGKGFVNVSASTVAVTNSTGGASGGSTATFTLTLGGRAGRVTYENIVAMGSISATANTAIFPQ